MNKVPMTLEGKNMLQEELNKLKFEKRPAISNAIAEARALGDLRENAEYHAAKEEQAFVEGRIQEIESKLSNSFVVDLTKVANNGRVVFGSKVYLFNYSDEKEVSYKIVGEDEADIKESKISVSSPIAKAVIGKSVEEDISVSTPNGIVEYRITKVDYV
jgi:transcription elongation factor GreA